MNLILLCFVLAALFIWTQRKGHPILAVVLKGAASFCFVLLGLRNGSQATRLIVAGLAFGCLADIVLGLRSVYKQKRNLFFITGGILFLLGHILYLESIWPQAGKKPLCIGISIILSTVLLTVLFKQIRAKKNLKTLGSLYFFALVLLTVTAVVGAVTQPSSFTMLFAAGTILFLTSDILLNLYSFGPGLPFIYRVLYSGLYYAAQILIAESIRFV